MELIVRYDILGSPNIGVFSLATDKFAIVPVNTQRNKVERIKRFLNVNIILVNIGASLLTGVLVAANSHGILLPHFAHEEDIKVLKSALNDINIKIIASKKNALGNLMLTNDYGAVVDPRSTREFVKAVKDILDVEGVPGEIAGLPYVGSLAVATNKGILAHPMLKDDERKTLEAVLKVPVDVGTINFGIPWVRSGLIANSFGAVVGSFTTGPELMMISRALGV